MGCRNRKVVWLYISLQLRHEGQTGSALRRHTLAPTQKPAAPRQPSRFRHSLHPAQERPMSLAALGFPASEVAPVYSYLSIPYLTIIQSIGQPLKKMQ